MFFYTLFPVAAAAVAMLMDLRTAKVDNGWIFFSMCFGFVFNLWENGVAGLGAFVAGSMLPVCVLGGLFLFRMMGAGDIKLFCVLGSMWGTGAVWKCICVSFVLALFISISIMISEGNFCHRIHYFISYIDKTIKEKKLSPYSEMNILSSESFHFTVPIFLSAVLYAGGVVGR